MAIDQYSICPCGNGKKIKFCKCHDHLAEISKIDRMIQGDQGVAALDHMNQLLKTLPSEPWLLAMKCELLLKLHETESLEETSAKFIRLQPDNALAKMYRSLVAIMRGNVEEAASLLVQAIAGSSGMLHPIFMTVVVNLIEMLMQRRQFISALMHAEMLLSIAGGSEETSEMANEIYNSLVTQEGVSILQREMPPSPPDADSEPYAERYREALALLGRYQVQQCKTKLDAIQREFGATAPLLIAKLHCQLLVVYIEGAAETCLKLAKTDGMVEGQQAYFEALAFELSSLKSGVAVQLEVASYVLEDDAAVEARLVSSTRLMPLKSDAIRGMFEALTREEVPPKATYLMAVPVFGETFAEFRPRQTGQWVAFVGRQTDKPPRLITLEATLGYQSNWARELREELGLANATREVIQTLPVSPVAFFNASVQVDKRPSNDLTVAFGQATRNLDRQHFLDFPVPLFNGGTPRSVAGKPEYKTDLLALLLFWQASGMTKLTAEDFIALHQELGLQQPKLSSESDTFDLVGGASYFWTDLETIEGDELLQLAQSALSRDVPTVFGVLSKQILSMKWPEESAIPADYTALCLRARASTNLEEAEQLLLQMIEKGKVLGVAVGNPILERVDMLRSLGRAEEANAFLQKSVRENPNDPVLQRFVQMMMMRMQQEQAAARGGGGVGSAMLGRGPAGAAEPSGLWTPGQSSASEPARQSASSSGSSGSGLWIPD
jgi:tetratricopeptide (TPR) repeat protein